MSLRQSLEMRIDVLRTEREKLLCFADANLRLGHEICVYMIGVTGCGKSSLGNTIFCCLGFDGDCGGNSPRPFGVGLETENGQVLRLEVARFEDDVDDVLMDYGMIVGDSPGVTVGERILRPGFREVLAGRVQDGEDPRLVNAAATASAATRDIDEENRADVVLFVDREDLFILEVCRKMRVERMEILDAFHETLHTPGLLHKGLFLEVKEHIRSSGSAQPGLLVVLTKRDLAVRRLKARKIRELDVDKIQDDRVRLKREGQIEKNIDAVTTHISQLLRDEIRRDDGWNSGDCPVFSVRNCHRFQFVDRLGRLHEGSPGASFCVTRTPNDAYCRAIFGLVQTILKDGLLVRRRRITSSLNTEIEDRNRRRLAQPLGRIFRFVFRTKPPVLEKKRMRLVPLSGKKRRGGPRHSREDGYWSNKRRRKDVAPLMLRIPPPPKKRD